MIIDGRKIAAEMLIEIADRATKLNFKPILCDVIVGDDPVSMSFVRIKQKKAESVGIEFKLVHIENDSSAEQAIEAIMETQKEDRLCGLIVQLPLPNSLEPARILGAIDPKVDVDIISPAGSENFYLGNSLLNPPTAGAILHILDSLHVDFSKHKFAVVGKGELVGKPTAYLLQERGFSVTAIDINTPNTAEILLSSDVIISGVGKPNLIGAGMIKIGAIVIDAGTSESGGSISGDVDFSAIEPVAKFITPVPGGVGPVTVAKLLENVIKVAENKANS